jgi:acyl-CoA synthetase (AMP-forming)/AMP-acid ligase II
VTWVSTTGVEIPDLVPARLRREWVARGFCPGVDLYRLFTAHVDAHPDRTAVIDDDGPVSYADLDLLVCGAAAELAAHGLGGNDIVAIRMVDSRRAVVAELAVAALGAVSMPFPAGRGTRDAVSLLARSGSAALVVDPGSGGPARWTGTTIPLVAARGHTRPEPAVSSAGPARVLVSSGSETEPKMVAYAHDAFGGRANYVRALHRGEGPMRNLVLVPLSSSFGSCGVPVTVAALGATLIVRARFDPAEAMRMITDHRPTHVFGVPTMLNRLADHATGHPPGLDALVSSGAALPGAVAERCRTRFGARVITVYGSTDGVNCHDAGDGRPDPAVAEITVTDADGHPLPPGARGEIRARGPMTPLSYVGDPVMNTRHRTHDGWVRTGDEGRLDENGVLHVTGRLKQVVLRGGLTISPAEVELHLSGHTAVAEATCVGIPDPDLGERLCACVVPNPRQPPPTLADLTAYLRTHHDLEPAKLPERLLLLPELPLGPTGKVCRTTLVTLATQAHAVS